MKKIFYLLTALLLLTACSPEQKAIEQMHRSYLHHALYPATVSFAGEWVEYATDSLFIIQVVIRELGDSGVWQRREMEYTYGIFDDERRELWKDLRENMSFLDYADLLLINDGLESPRTKEEAVEYEAWGSLLINGKTIHE